MEKSAVDRVSEAQTYRRKQSFIVILCYCLVAGSTLPLLLINGNEVNAWLLRVPILFFCFCVFLMYYAEAAGQKSGILGYRPYRRYRLFAPNATLSSLNLGTIIVFGLGYLSASHLPDVGSGRANQAPLGVDTDVLLLATIVSLLANYLSSTLFDSANSVANWSPTNYARIMSKAWDAYLVAYYASLIVFLVFVGTISRFAFVATLLAYLSCATWFYYFMLGMYSADWYKATEIDTESVKSYLRIRRTIYTAKYYLDPSPDIYERDMWDTGAGTEYLVLHSKNKVIGGLRVVRPRLTEANQWLLPTGEVSVIQKRLQFSGCKDVPGDIAAIVADVSRLVLESDYRGRKASDLLDLTPTLPPLTSEMFRELVERLVALEIRFILCSSRKERFTSTYEHLGGRLAGEADGSQPRPLHGYSVKGEWFLVFWDLREPATQRALTKHTRVQFPPTQVDHEAAGD